MKAPTLLALLCSALVLLVSACSNLVTTAPDGTQVKMTPAQIATAVCPDVQDAMAELMALNGLSDMAKLRLTQGKTVVDRVCAVGAVPDIEDLQSILKAGAPFAIDIINASSLSDEKKNNLVLGIMAAKIVANHYLAATRQ
jgi:hypothetical protein